jgi:hypothetical protein
VKSPELSVRAGRKSKALPVELDQILVRPLRSRIFQPRENLIRSVILIQTPAGEEALIMSDAAIRTGFDRH